MIIDKTLKEELKSLANQQTIPPKETIQEWLGFNGIKLKTLYLAADEIRHEFVGDAIYVRGIIEFSNYCRRNCYYCGIRAGNKSLQRYRMVPQEIVNLAHQALHYGCTTVVLQSGEDPHFSAKDICEIIEQIKVFPNLAVTLSIGELHPDDDYEQRLLCLKMIRRAGLQLGSGFMIGLPHAGIDIIADDIIFTTKLKLDMIGVGPFIAHPQTPLACKPRLPDLEIYFKVIAILRILNPYAHIPATTAYDALVKLGRDKCLQIGANVFMPNITPQRYRTLYQLYPNKPCVDEDGDQCASCTLSRILRLGRQLGKDEGHSFLPEWNRYQAQVKPAIATNPPNPSS
ncbi:MAG: [FeFe] hydrogenase H-cluster radical SAM maturase HydE [Candidatus Bathyarchaeia archaeon]